jgi:hypothetical protein
VIIPNQFTAIDFINMILNLLSGLTSSILCIFLTIFPLLLFWIFLVRTVMWLRRQEMYFYLLAQKQALISLAYKMRLARRVLPKRRKRLRHRIKSPCPENMSCQSRLIFHNQSYVSDTFIREFTLISALLQSLRSVSDRKGVIAALVLYAQAHSKKSLFGQIKDFLLRRDDLFASVTSHVNELRNQSATSEEEWITSLKDCLSNWKKFRSHENVTNVLELFNYAVSIGLCEASSLTFSIGKLSVFKPVVSKQQLSCEDLLEVVVKTAIGFVEGGWRVYSTGDVSSFFEHEDKFAEFEEKYSYIRSIHGYSLCGNLRDHTEITENDYEGVLDAALAIGTALAQKIPRNNYNERKFVTDRMDRIRDWKCEFQQVRVRGGFKMAPWAMSFFGDTGVGKSSVNALFIEAVGFFNGLDFSHDRQAIWADNDKYASNINASTNVITFDDFCNTKAMFMDFSPCYRLIQVINNALFLAPKAEAHLKGKVALHPWLVTITTNVQDLMAHMYSEKPESILRRMYHTTVEVKEEFKTNGVLDTEKVVARFGHVKDPDIWELTVHVAVVGMPHTHGSNKRNIHFEVISYKGKKLEKVDIHTFLEWAQVASKEYYSSQKKLVDTVKNGPPAKACKHCKFAFCKCAKFTMEDELNRQNGSNAVGFVNDINPNRVPLVVEPEIADDEERNRDFEQRYELHQMVSELEAMGCGEDVQDDIYENQALVSTPLRVRVMRFIFWYCVGFFGQIFLQLFLRCLAHVIQILENPYFQADLREFITDLRRKCLWQIYRFARWQQQTRWNLRAFFIQMKNVATTDLLRMREFYLSSLFDPVAWIPECVVSGYHLSFILMYFRRYNLIDSYQKVLAIYLMTAGASVWFVFHGMYVRALIIWLSILFVIAALLRLEQLRIEREINRRRDVFRSMFTLSRETSIKCLIGAGMCFSLVMIVRFLLDQRKFYSDQGNLCPKTMEDINTRNAEVNPWSVVQTADKPMSLKAKTTSADDLERSMPKSILWVQGTYGGNRVIEHYGFMMESRVLVLTKHFIEKFYDIEADVLTRKEKYQEDIVLCCSPCTASQTGGHFRTRLSANRIAPIPGTDLAVVAVESGSYPDRKQFLPLSAVHLSEVRLIMKHSDGYSAHPSLYRRSVGGYRNSLGRIFQGGNYTLNFDTRDGMCMAPLISVGRGTQLVGFHTAGNGKAAAAAALLRSEYDAAVEMLQNKSPSFMKTPNAGTLPEEQYGVPLVDQGDVHRKSAVRFLSSKPSVEVYGPVSGRATPSSTVTESVISKTVEAVCGVPNQWGPPKLKGEGVYPFQVALENMTHLSLNCGDVLDTAYKCLFREFRNLKYTLPDLFKIGPLTDIESTSGNINQKFVDALNFSTGPGWPLSGAKSRMAIVLNIDDYPDSGLPRTFPDDIWKEVARLKTCFLAGERGYAVWKACLKDEPTKVTKTKVRVFQSSPLALQLLIRKYFLPIARICQLNPFVSECAVGINAEGPEWHQLDDYITSKGPNILAGDYSAYDQSMSSDLVIASLKLLTSIARMCSGYTEDDFKIMEGISGEIAYPLMAYNGDLIQLFGTNPSGQNLTALVNSLANSLLLRCGYYTIYGDKFMDFKVKCSFITYGDDFKGSVAPDREGFNHLSYCDYLSTLGMKLTMPDKTSDPVPYLTSDDCDFLKRKTRYMEELQCKVGVLDESSIFKRLHAHLASKELTQQQLAAQNIGSSLHDWFYYGRNIYEQRLTEMKVVAERSGIDHLCREYFVPFDTRVTAWKEKYGIGIDAS